MSIGRSYPFGWNGKSVEKSKSTDLYFKKERNKTRSSIVLAFDGLYRDRSRRPEAVYYPMYGSSGLITYGWMVGAGDLILGQGYGAHINYTGATSNAAEYFALIHGLESLIDMGFQRKRIIIRGDSKTVIEQMQGIVQVSSLSVIPLYRFALDLSRKFFHIQWQWVPRKYNKAPDHLTRKALKQYRLHIDHFGLNDILLQGEKTFEEECRNPLFDLNIYNQRLKFAGR